MYGLYHTLNVNLRKSDITRIEKLKILDSVEKMSQEELEAFFMLIYEHHRVSTEEEVDLPYGCQQSGGGIQINMSKLPIQLRRVLLKFVNMILEKKNDSSPQFGLENTDTK